MVPSVALNKNDETLVLFHNLGGSDKVDERKKNIRYV